MSDIPSDSRTSGSSAFRIDLAAITAKGTGTASTSSSSTELASVDGQACPFKSCPARYGTPDPAVPSQKIPFIGLVDAYCFMAHFTQVMPRREESLADNCVRFVGKYN